MNVKNCIIRKDFVSLLIFWVRMIIWVMREEVLRRMGWKDILWIWWVFCVIFWFFVFVIYPLIRFYFLEIMIYFIFIFILILCYLTPYVQIWYADFIDFLILNEVSYDRYVFLMSYQSVYFMYSINLLYQSHQKIRKWHRTSFPYWLNQ